MDTSDRVFEWWHNGDRLWVVANWQEARQYHLNSYCGNCGLVYAKRGGKPGYCPDCFSDDTYRLFEKWEGLDDPWDSDPDPDEIEETRITNY